MARRKPRKSEQLRAPEHEYRSADGDVLALRGAMTPGTRVQYTQVLKGEGLSAAAAREDAWQRAVEFLFERLAVRWEIAGLPLESQKELLGRLRMASADEKRFVQRTLADHLAERYPEVTV